MQSATARFSETASSAHRSGRTCTGCAAGGASWYEAERNPNASVTPTAWIARVKYPAAGALPLLDECIISKLLLWSVLGNGVAA